MMTNHWRSAAVAATAITLLTGCGLTGPFTTQGAELSEWFTVTSPAFHDDGQMPVRFGCSAYPGGQGRTPPLRWSVGASSTPKAFAIVMDDPDAPEGAAVHWVIANLDGTTAELAEGADRDTANQGNAVEGANTFGKVGYSPPCPAKGEQHRYRFTIYALSEKVSLVEGATPKVSLPEIAKRTIGRGRITGNFGSTQTR
jgi:Raf kinase inhibitor-like YbhB/YbcL family protein